MWFSFPFRFLYLNLWLNQREEKATMSKASIPVFGNVRFNAVCTALIYILVHSYTALNYIIICFMQCSK